jgi:hypothetical protein
VPSLMFRSFLGADASSGQDREGGMNLCRPCGEDFSTLRAFDAHQVGSTQHDWSLEQPDGFRCLGLAELEDLGWRKNAHGRWQDSISIRSARKGIPVSLRAPETVPLGSGKGEAP